MKKIIFLVICFAIGVLVYQKKNEIVIPNSSIRVRIIANSNNISDLYEKKKLKDEIKKDIYDLVKDASSMEEADKVLKNNINNINSLIANKTKDFSVSYGSNYFPRKIYKGVLYNAGEYPSLVITLGKGLGDNWWCVLYPPLCMMEDNPHTEDVEYRLFVADWLKIDKN